MPRRKRKKKWALPSRIDDVMGQMRLTFPRERHCLLLLLFFLLLPSARAITRHGREQKVLSLLFPTPDSVIPPLFVFRRGDVRALVVNADTVSFIFSHCTSADVGQLGRDGRCVLDNSRLGIMARHPLDVFFYVFLRFYFLKKEKNDRSWQRASSVTSAVLFSGRCVYVHFVSPGHPLPEAGNRYIYIYTVYVGYSYRVYYTIRSIVYLTIQWCFAPGKWLLVS